MQSRQFVFEFQSLVVSISTRPASYQVLGTQRMIQGCLQSMRWADSQTDQNKCLHVGNDTQHKALWVTYMHMGTQTEEMVEKLPHNTGDICVHA